MGNKFFERGNLALDWEFIKQNWVAIDANGRAREFIDMPQNYQRCGSWDSIGSSILGYVGAECQDWRDLLFERPKAPRLPDGFWEAVDMIIGAGYEWFYFSNGVHPAVSKVAKDDRDDGHDLEYVNGLQGIVATFLETKRPFLRIGQTKAD